MTGTCKRIRHIICVLALLALPILSANAADVPWRNARQLILVITPDWNASHALLRTYTRGADGWQTVAEATPVVIGRSGSAWGIGLHPSQAGVQKKEGDGRSPAGVFGLGIAFGYAESASSALPYSAMDANDWCIDVDGSPLYNRIVDARDTGTAAIAGSTEPMRRDLHADGDTRYKLGFVIEHNPRGKAGAGSCIFAHLWKSAGSSTAGCTAMTESAMQSLLAWLRPGEHPVFVLLPQHEYERLWRDWNLPQP